MRKTIDLLEYYRSQVNHETKERSRPPAGYWIRCTDKATVWGVLIDGDLVAKGRTDVYEKALDECWNHFDRMMGNDR